ncbi:MAG TPA: hypothetical protein VMJ66_03350 [Geobacteraceae bacterium]|nr:hypothetical protein [Geobacteraceae bacterium]
MNTASIDEAMEKYLQERMVKGRDAARERFLANAYLKHGGDEVLVFLLKVGGLARHYIRHLRLMENSIRWPELTWFSIMAAVGAYGYGLMAQDESWMLGAVLLAGTLVHAWSLIRMITRKTREIDLRIALYGEIIQIVEKELSCII